MKSLLIAAGLAATLAAPLAAQEMRTGAGTGAVLRGLDKVDAGTDDFNLADGEVGQLGDLSIQLVECRFPADNPSGDAYALLRIDETTRQGETRRLFDGWMVASSPALNALDHFRYDVWVLRCDIPEGYTPPPPPEPEPQADPSEDPANPYGDQAEDEGQPFFNPVLPEGFPVFRN